MAVFSLSFSSAGKGQLLTGIFLKQLVIVLVNLQEVAGSKRFLELLLEAVNFTSYRLIRRTLNGNDNFTNHSITAAYLNQSTPVVTSGYWKLTLCTVSDSVPS